MMNCPKEHCLLCELGFVVRMLQDAHGTHCQASNFCNALGVLTRLVLNFLSKHMRIRCAIWLGSIRGTERGHRAHGNCHLGQGVWVSAVRSQSGRDTRSQEPQQERSAESLPLAQDARERKQCMVVFTGKCSNWQFLHVVSSITEASSIGFIQTKS